MTIPEDPSDPCYAPTDGYCAGGEGSIGFSDEGVWLIDANNADDAIEVGYRTGWAPFGPCDGFTTDLQPYYTTDNGNNEVNACSSYFIADETLFWMAEVNSGSTAYVQVDTWEPNPGSYTVSTPRKDYAQGETLYGDDGMGGGNGEDLTMYFQPVADFPDGWDNWGEFTSCEAGDNSSSGAPFDYSESCGLEGTTYIWRNGGYGNGDFGS